MTNTVLTNTVLADIYGRGWAFPPQFSIKDNIHPEIATGVTMAEGAENVRQNMKILFLTEPGERIMRENYGCGLSDYLFANIRDEMMAEIQTRIEERVLRYEPRADISEIQVNQRTDVPNTLHIQVTYTLRGSEIGQQIEGALEINEGRVQVSL
ncbi:phage baseplate protein [Photorhabdus luminescens subsp. luminescens]|uniref:IraD/Gp25-like domain-containing protein n=3 Tax=Photorhabdus luminescens TaxID=29488 RepID=A0A1G5QBT1_PHOLU|nr:GPW/gp25 family protein [Photorhabdus luminescens]KMW71370.1 phage baseplate protein [Photorhabdus luminescens subsp. luminescens]MCW7760576.1 GPW/gp25 family protein [Photorhabdus luminescens subsp. venezuelensis]OWO84266.1 phage baseplate protein [Photorhabdus luminescens]TDB53516.1 phage baseplate protein [Photorhabdus luminescens subsp. mexicana]TNH41649.1 phage baseplate protein [Photorhabdus luminescens subsp. sonorensis]